MGLRAGQSAEPLAETTRHRQEDQLVDARLEKKRLLGPENIRKSATILSDESVSINSPGLMLERDVDTRPVLLALGQDAVDRVRLERINHRGVRLRRQKRLRVLLEEVVVAGGPATRTKTRRMTAVVDHEGHALEVHVRVQGVDRLDDGLVCDLGVAVPLRHEEVALGDHHGDVDSGGGRVHLARVGVRRLPRSANLLADLPHLGAADVSHRESVKISDLLAHRTDLPSRAHLLVALHVHFHAGLVGRTVGLLEQSFVEAEKEE